MQADVFAKRCRMSLPINPSSRVLVMVKVNDTGQMFSVKGVKLERHEDGDGSETLWIEVEDF